MIGVWLICQSLQAFSFLKSFNNSSKSYVFFRFHHKVCACIMNSSKLTFASSSSQWCYIGHHELKCQETQFSDHYKISQKRSVIFQSDLASLKITQWLIGPKLVHRIFLGNSIVLFVWFSSCEVWSVKVEREEYLGKGATKKKLKKN